MPRQIDDDDEMPRRRRRKGARAVAVEPGEERGLVMRMLLHSPKDMVAGALAIAAVVAIVINALFLQAGRHPSPMFGSVVILPSPASPVVASPVPRPRPVEIATRPVEPAPVETRPAAEPTRPSEPTTGLTFKSPAAPPASVSNVLRPPAPIPARHETTQSAASRRIAAVQRTLTEYGYGQLKPTGTIGADTQTAILKFERERRLPVSGQMSDRLVRELSAMTGRPVE